MRNSLQHIRLKPFRSIIALVSIKSALFLSPLQANLLVNGDFESGGGWVLGAFTIVSEGNPGGCAKASNGNVALYQNIPAWKLPLTPRPITISASRKATPFGTSSHGGVWLYGFITGANQGTGTGLIGDSRDYDAITGWVGYYGNGFWYNWSVTSSKKVGAAQFPYGMRLIIDCSYRTQSGWVLVDNVVVTTGVAGAAAGDAIPGTPKAGVPGGWEFDLALDSSGLGTKEPIWIDPEYAFGYEYEITGGAPNFSGVYLPDIGDGLFDLQVWRDGIGWADFGEIQASAVHRFKDFEGLDWAVRKFRILGIEEEAMVDPTLGGAFPTALLFDAEGLTSLTMTGLAIPEPGTWAVLTGLTAFLLALMGRRKRA
jgi:hypothetical protein